MLSEATFSVIGFIGSTEVTEKNGKKYAVVSIGVDDSYTPKDGEKVEKTNWCRIVTFSPNNVDFVQKFLDKGRYIRVTGRISNIKREKDGETIYSTDLIAESFDFLDRKPS